MPHWKFLARGLFALFIFAIFLLTIIYYSYLTPQKRAAAHLDFIHQSIAEMHPAMLDPNATAFNSWHTSGYAQAKALLADVDSVDDETALLNFYFAGYEDAHLAGNMVKSPFKFLDADDQYWTGWLLKATLDGYEVNYSLANERYPPTGAQLLSCDGQPIDNLLKEKYAPYLDKRWQLLNARDKSAKVFTRTGATPRLHRPTVNYCNFLLASGAQQNYRVAWEKLDEQQIQHINTLGYFTYQYPAVREFAPNSYWVTVSDFQLNTPEAYQHHQQLIADLKNINNAELVVFDTRTNLGGLSSFGDEILRAYFGSENYFFLLGNIHNSDATIRASWKFYWSNDYQLAQATITQGKDSPAVKFTEILNARLKKALDNNETTFKQSELNFDLNNEHENGKINQWKAKGAVIALTSRLCVSSCLDFMDYLKQIPGLVHMGEPTDGDTVYPHIAYMWSEYAQEGYSFIVPVKKYDQRMRADNQAYIPDIIYRGNIYDDKAVEHWVLEQAQQIIIPSK